MNRTSSSSPHLVIATFGSYGDVYPYIAIAREWQARGGLATIATSAFYRDTIEAANVRFSPLRPDLLPQDDPELYSRMMNPRQGGSRLLLKKLVDGHLRATYADLFEATTDADVFLSHSMCVAAPLVAAKRSVATPALPTLPWVSGVVSPMFFQSTVDPSLLPIVPGLTTVPFVGPALARTWNHVWRKATNDLLPTAQLLRRELRLPSGSHPLAARGSSPHRILSLASSVLAPPQRDWPTQTRVTGFCHYDRANSTDPASPVKLDPLLEAFLQAGPPPILFTLGASSAATPGDFWHESTIATKLLKQRAIYVTGDGIGHGATPQSGEDIYVTPYVPLSAIVQRCVTVVNHGGIGTIALCLQAGKPMLIMPQAHDQPDNAYRTTRTGAARSLSCRHYKGAMVARELQQLQPGSSYAKRAREIAGQLVNENGPATACDYLEQELRSRHKRRAPHRSTAR